MLSSISLFESPPPRSFYRFFTDGVFVSVRNPKIAVFFLAFLPQLVDPGNGAVTRQVLLLGLLYVLLALFTESAYALLASNLRRGLGGRMMQGPALRYASGVIDIGLGVGTAVTD